MGEDWAGPMREMLLQSPAEQEPRGQKIEMYNLVGVKGSKNHSKGIKKK